MGCLPLIIKDMVTSKIKEVVSAKPFTNSYGTTIYHNLVMDNGDKINIGKKNEQKVGFELTYEIIGDKRDDGSYQQEYPKAKAVKKDFKQPFDQKGIEVGHALNNAVNLVCAGVEFDSVDLFKNNEEKIYKYAKVILALAKKLKNE